MQCPICEADNAANDAICGSCGAALPRSDAAPSHGSALMVGAKLADGHFTIGKVLGKGGFGITYLGSDMKLRRSVAIKELFPSGCTRVDTIVQPGGNWPEARFELAKEKFLQEAQTLAQFQHPNICYVHSSFEENNTAYMVMEYIKGNTLLRILKDHGSLDEENSVNCTLQLCEALRTIHNANVLHRDVKPGNILLADDGRVVLIDFGTAREFAAEAINHMTMMLTPGYAPIEQYTQSGKMGPFTDIYAAGATLYHLLTGRQPVAATDRANGAVLAQPYQLNPAISRTVSDAVMWAMQISPDQRPQNVDQFLAGLAGRESGPVSRFSQGFDRSLEPEGADINPHKDRIEAILAELEAGTPQAPPSKHDEEIDQITAQLGKLTKTKIKSFPVCPVCAESTMKEATGESGEGTCPICKSAKLDIREHHLRRCPVCRDGALESHQVEINSTMCPVCGAGAMVHEKRRKFGLAIDDWLVCLNCRAEMNLVLGGQARLARVQSDPRGIGKKYLDQVLPLLDWRQISTRHDKYLECPKCRAQFDADEDKNLTLVQSATDPFGVAARYKGQKLSRATWANLAEGFDTDAGNASCPACSATFNIDTLRSEITVLRSDEAAYPWSKKMQGKAFALKAWYLSEAGKRSMVPGWICTHCKTEFDKQENVLKLMWTAAGGPLSGREGQVHTVEGWHRIAVGLPTKSEESKLRDKLTRLHILKQEQNTYYHQEEAKYQATLRDELDTLIRQAFVAGYVPILLKDERIFLLDNETLYWESPAKRHKRISQGGSQAWTLETRGVLALTNQRIIFDNRTALWQHAIDDIEQVSIDDVAHGGMVAFTMRDYPAPIGFEIGDAQFTVTTEFSNHTIRANPRDLVLLAMAIKKRESGGEPAAQPEAKAR